MGRSAEAAWESVLAVALGMLLGYYLDRWLGTAPWLLLTFLGFGLVTGFQRLMRLLKQSAPGPDAAPDDEGDSDDPTGGRP